MPWTAASHKTTKSIDTQYGARGATAFGSTYIYEQTPPSKSSTFRSEAITTSERDTLQACADAPTDQAGSTAAISVQSVTWTGKVLSFSWAVIIGNSAYVSAELELSSPVSS